MKCTVAECKAAPPIQMMVSDGSCLLHEWSCCPEHAEEAWKACLSHLTFRTPYQRQDELYVPVYLEMMHVDRRRDSQYAYLCESGGIRRFSWAVGYPEAIHLYNRLKYGPMEHRQTHDFIHRLILQLGGEIVRIAIENKESHDQYHAVVQIAQSDRSVVVDCRPSDALILSVCCSLPLLVRDNLLASR